MTVVRRLHAVTFVLGLAACAHRAPAPQAAQPPPLDPEPVAAKPPAPVAVRPTGRIVRIVRPKGSLGGPIFSVKTDRAHVYFNDGAGRLWAAPKDGSAPAVALVADPQDSVRSFVVLGDIIYYAARHDLRSIPVTGGTSTREVADRAGPLLLVSDGVSVYLTVFDGSGTFRFTLATHKQDRFCAGGKHQTLAVDDSSLYIASYSAGTITAVSKKTRLAHVLASGQRRPVRLVVDRSWVYFASEADGTVRRVPKRGGRAEILAQGQHDQEHLAIDDSYIYWTTRTQKGSALMRAPLVPSPSSPPDVLYAGLSSAAGIAVDETFVYVADRGAGEVVRVPKVPE